MATTAKGRLEIKREGRASWAIPLDTAAGAVVFVLVALAGAAGFIILLLISPIVIGLSALQAFRNRQSAVQVVPARWSERPRSSLPRDPLVIDGDYEVIDTDGA